MTDAWKGIVNLAKRGTVRFAGPLGLYALTHRLTRNEPRILMYHRFGPGGIEPGVSASVFHDQVRMLRKQCSVITLSELAARIEADELEPDLAVITADDGHEDFHRIAFPVLQSEGVSATFFVTTRFIDGDIWLWPDVVEYLLENTSVASPDLRRIGVPEVYNLGTDAARKVAWRALVTLFIDLASNDRAEKLAVMAQILDVAIPPAPDPSHAPLSWEKVVDLSQAGIEIGAHTLTHPVLVSLPDDELKKEICGSKERIEEKIGRSVKSFCYPNGAPGDYDSRVVEVVKQSGFECAVVAHADGRTGDIFRLRRTGVDNNMFDYRKTLAGIDRLSNWAKRRSEYV